MKEIYLGIDAMFRGKGFTIDNPLLIIEIHLQITETYLTAPKISKSTGSYA